MTDKAEVVVAKQAQIVPAGVGLIPQSKKRVSLVAKIAEKYSVDAEKMLVTLKNTAFKSDVQISNEQMMALLIVADQYNLNPFTKEIYAFPDKKRGGIVPVVGLDGWSRIINENKNCNGIQFRYSDDMIQIDEDAKRCPEWIECTIYRKDRAHNEPVREYLDEVYRPIGKYQDGNKMKPGPWQTHTKRFLRHKVLIQAARITMGFVGIYDQDEAERIVEAETAYEIPYTEAEKAEFDRLFNDGDTFTFWLFWTSLDVSCQVALFNTFPKKERGSDVPGITECKAKIRKIEADGLDMFNSYCEQANDLISLSDSDGLIEIKSEMRTEGWDRLISCLEPEDLHKAIELTERS